MKVETRIQVFHTPFVFQHFNDVILTKAVKRVFAHLKSKNIFWEFSSSQVPSNICYLLVRFTLQFVDFSDVPFATQCVVPYSECSYQAGFR
jgi:hypothetical protein